MLNTDQLLQIFADGLGDEQVGGKVFPCRSKSDPARALMGLLAQLILGQQTILSGEQVASPPFNGAPTDHSIASLTGSAQVAAVANPARRYLLIQNPSVTAPLYWSFTGTATTDSLRIPPGGFSAYENPAHFCPPGAISVLGTAAEKAIIITA